MKTKQLKRLALAVTLALPWAANAESNFQTGAGTPLTATAHVDFTITIPKILFLQVGTGTLLANNVAVDLITFNVPAASVGNGIAQAGTGGDLTNGVVTAIVIGNNGAVTLTATNGGALTDAAGDTIPYTEINTVAAVRTSATALQPPILVNGASAPITVNPNVGAKVVNMDAKWTYTYKNSAVVPPGTYGGVNVQNGRVTYTASMP